MPPKTSPKPDQFLYQVAPLCLEFEATITHALINKDGHPAVLLDRTYFYPTGGGQEHDTGIIYPAGEMNPVHVIDVYYDQEKRMVVHVLDQPLKTRAGESITARIDSGRRMRHMQHHSAQHLLTQCFIAITGLETVSANINGDTPSTLDLSMNGHATGESRAHLISSSELKQVEDLANQIIYENREIKTYFVESRDLATVPLRRIPPALDHLRIVEIDGYDYSACGGTHCPRTGMIGVVKILKVERQNEKLRVSFVAGQRALEYFQECHATLSQIATQLSVHIQDLATAIQHMQEQLKETQKELQLLRAERLHWEAEKLLAAAEPLIGRKLVLASFKDRPVIELRMLGEILKEKPEAVALFTSYDGQKISLVAACGSESGLAAQDVLRDQLATFNGRGGGDAHLAQGGGAASREQFDALLAGAAEKLAVLIRQ
jgi:alanyl-tRNA synthetase